MINPLSGGPFGAAWHAFFQQGVWAPGVSFITTADVNNGDTQIRVNALPDTAPFKLNLFEPIRTPSPGVPGAGFGKLLRLDPAGEDIGVEIRGVDPFLTDIGAGDLIISLAEPVTGLLISPLPSGAEIGPGRSPVIGVGAYPKKVRLIGTTHGTDAVGDDNAGAGYSTTPDISVNIFGGDNQEGPFHSIGAIPAGAIPASPGGPGNVIGSSDYVIPSLPFIYFEIVPGGSDGGDTIYSLQVSFTLP